MRNKNVVRLTESQLKQMIAESVNNVLSEIDWGGLSQDEWVEHIISLFKEY